MGKLQSFAVSDTEVHRSFTSLMVVLFNSLSNGCLKKQ